VLLRHAELALLLEARAGLALTQGLECGQMLGELLRETPLCGRGLLVLRAGRRRGGNVTPLECLVEAVELWKKEVAIAVVLRTCVLSLRVCARVGSSAAACAGRLCPPAYQDWLALARWADASENERLRVSCTRELRCILCASS